MATTKQRQTARKNIKSAQTAARKKRTIANLPASTRHELGKQAAKGRARHGHAGSRVFRGTSRERLNGDRVLHRFHARIG